MDGRKSQSVKYQQIADDIRLKILGGIYARNEMLPSEKKLGEKYGASRLTIRNTLNLLENEGYIYTKAGKGSFVKGVSTDMIKGSQTDFREEIVINGIIPEAWLKEKMDIDSKNTDSVLLVERKIYDDRGTPTGLDRLYLNADESCIKGVFSV